MITSLLAAGRARAESLMRDQCLIRRRTGEITDPNSGVITPTYATVYSGKCRVQQRSPGGVRTTEAGEAYQLMLRMEVQVPTSVTGLRVGDEVTITSSVLDLDLGGRKFWVRELAHKTHATMRRLGVEEVT